MCPESTQIAPGDGLGVWPRHCLSVSDFSPDQIRYLFQIARGFSVAGGCDQSVPILSGKVVACLFFESSTRTRCSFERAVSRLSGEVLHFAVTHSAAAHKGESFSDTLLNLYAMGVQIFVIRHPQPGAAHFAATVLPPAACVINAGDGCHAHPTQALLDVFTLLQNGLHLPESTVAIVGDMRYSRVARSYMAALSLLGTKAIHLVAPPAFLPHYPPVGANVRLFHCVREGIAGADAVMILRPQKERFISGPTGWESQVIQQMQVTEAVLAACAPTAIVLHPGPVTRGVEVASAVIDGARSRVLQQVRHGVLVRMAVLSQLMQHTTG